MPVGNTLGVQVQDDSGKKSSSFTLSDDGNEKKTGKREHSFK